MSIDPVQFSANMPFMFNRYAYVEGDPVNMVDPDGKHPDHPEIDAELEAAEENHEQAQDALQDMYDSSSEADSYEEYQGNIETGKRVADAAAKRLKEAQQDKDDAEASGTTDSQNGGCAAAGVASCTRVRDPRLATACSAATAAVCVISDEVIENRQRARHEEEYHEGENDE